MTAHAQPQRLRLWCSCCSRTADYDRRARIDGARVSAMPQRVRRLIKAVCRQSGVKPAIVLGARKDRFAAQPRATLAKALREMGYSYPVIGEWLGRDHSTVMTMVAGRKRP